MHHQVREVIKMIYMRILIVILLGVIRLSATSNLDWRDRDSVRREMCHDIETIFKAQLTEEEGFDESLRTALSACSSRRDVITHFAAVFPEKTPRDKFYHIEVHGDIISFSLMLLLDKDSKYYIFTAFVAFKGDAIQKVGHYVEVSSLNHDDLRPEGQKPSWR